MSDAPIPAPPALPVNYVPSEEILALIGQTPPDPLNPTAAPTAPEEQS